jgi:hypothetical protein
MAGYDGMVRALLILTRQEVGKGTLSFTAPRHSASAIARGF